MINRLRVTIEPKKYTEADWLALKCEVQHDDTYTTYENILPNNDHLHSTLDYMWEVAKSEIEKRLETFHPISKHD